MMNNGFVPIATASPMVKVADPHYNADLIYDELQKAAAKGAKVVAFPEMTMTSYVANDLLYHSILLDSTEQELARLLQRTADLDVLFSLGMPLCLNGKIYNVLAICLRGRILGVVPKTFIPTYGVDFEGRWFSSGPAAVSPITIAGQHDVPFGSHQVFRNEQMPAMCLGFEICEDIWSPEPPSIRLALAGATMLINGSASNASLGKDVYRRGLISGQSARLLACYAYCSSGQGDSTGDVTVGGQELICENGAILAEAKPFGEAFAIADIDVESLWGARRGMSSFHVAATAADADYHETTFTMTIPEHDLIRPVSPLPFVPADTDELDDSCDLALAMQAHGLLTRIRNQHVSTIVIDTTASGTLDAAMALVATAEGVQLSDLDPSAVHVVDTNAGDEGDHSFIHDLAQTYGFGYHELAVFDEDTSMGRHTDAAVQAAEHAQTDAAADVATQPTSSTHATSTNDTTSQALALLQLASSDPQALLINPCDMTELALGLVEFPLDIAHQYAINSQMARTFMPSVLARYAEMTRNAEASHVLQVLTSFEDHIDVPQHDRFAVDGDGNVGPIDVVDFFIDALLRAQYRPAKAFRLAHIAFAGTYSDEQLLDWMEVFYRRFFATQFMRYSLPDGPRLGSAGLDLHSGVMLPNFADPSIWLNEVATLRK